MSDCPRCHGEGRVMVQNYVGMFDDDERYIQCLEPGCTTWRDKYRKRVAKSCPCYAPKEGEDEKKD